jgi:hypothetical protein
MDRKTASSIQAAKIAFLVGLFEKLVVETGAKRRRIEQLLAELSEDRRDDSVGR